jgi:hypothetical protein
MLNNSSRYPVTFLILMGHFVIYPLFAYLHTFGFTFLYKNYLLFIHIKNQIIIRRSILSFFVSHRIW